MLLKDILLRIQKVSQGSVFTDLAYMSTEVGELNQAVLSETRVKPRDLEPAYIEAVDVILCALSVYQKMGGENLAKDLENKLTKWESSPKMKYSLSLQE